MSRPPPSKSRGDKTASRGAAGAQSVAATVTVSNDIVPGRLTEAEWLRLVVEDDDTSFLGSIVDEILDKTLDKCYEKYIWNQLIPYTVDHAKNSILQIVEWHFLSRDVGEKDIANDTGWKEDSEPEAGVIDSWAQGSVPVIMRPQSSLAPSVSAISESMPEPSNLSLQPVEDSIGFESEPATTVVDQHTETAEKPKETVTDSKTKTPVKVKKPAAPESNFSQESTDYGKKKKRRVYKRHTGRLPPLPSTVEAPEDESKDREKLEKEASFKVGMHLSPSQKSLIKSQAGRPPGNREVTFDERGNVVGVMKLNVHTLPTHKVRVQYHVIDPTEANAQKLPGLRYLQAHKGNKSAAKSIDTKTINSTRKSEVSGSYKTRDLALTVQQFPPGVDTLVRSQRGSKASVREKKIRGARIDPLPPLLIEAIEASPGVVIQEGEHIKKGPAEVYPNNVSHALGKSTTGPGTRLRMVGDRVFRSKMRPIFDPSDVVEVDPQKQIIYAVSSGLQRTMEQTAES